MYFSKFMWIYLDLRRDLCGFTCAKVGCICKKLNELDVILWIYGLLLHMQNVTWIYVDLNLTKYAHIVKDSDKKLPKLLLNNKVRLMPKMTII